jgi:DNA-cytosine methyltransferase
MNQAELPQEGIRVLSLFDGMSGGQQALERAGIKVAQYYASEIDKHAITVTMANYPNTIQLGSVVNVKAADLPKIDLVVGGSPCQSFSFAGKRKGMATKCETEILTLKHYLELKAEGYEFEGQSYLFWEFMRLLKEVRPTYFLLENVEMGEKWETVLRKAIGVQALHINSALVSAQNRRRIYFTNIGMQPMGLFGDLESIIKQPKDRGILLKDVLEKDVPEKYYLSEKMLNYFETRSANFNGGKVNIREEEGKSTAILASSASIDISDNFIKVDTNLKKSTNQDKANCFTAGGNSGGLHSDMTLIGCVKFGRTDEAKEMRKESMKKGKDHTPFQAKEITDVDYEKMNTLTTVGNKDNLLIVAQRGMQDENGNWVQQFEQNDTGKTNTITSVQKDNLIMLNDRQKANHKNDNQKSNTLLSTMHKGSQANGMTLVGSTMVNTSRIRRLTPLECERLQTVRDNFTAHVSDTQRYRMLGNGFTIEVIAHIFSYMK